MELIAYLLTKFLDIGIPLFLAIFSGLGIVGCYCIIVYEIISFFGELSLSGLQIRKELPKPKGAKVLTINNSKTKGNVIIIPPGTLLLKIADYLPKKESTNLKQEISDMRLEHNEALSIGDSKRAKIVVRLYYVGLGWAVLIWIIDKVKALAGIKPKGD